MLPDDHNIEDPIHHFVDHHQVRMRRTELRMSEGMLADRLRVGSIFVRRLEAGCSQARIDFRMLADLAAALSVPVASLLTSPALVSNSDEEPTSPSDAAAQVGRLLSSAEEPVPVEAVAAITGLTYEQTLDAVETVITNLAAVGMTVARSDGMLSIHPDVQPDDDTFTRTLTASISRRGLALNEARCVRRLIAGDTRSVDPGSQTAFVVGRLTKAGVVDRHVERDRRSRGDKNHGNAQRPLVLSDDARFSLMLDDLDGP